MGLRIEQRTDRRTIAFSAAAMYAGATFTGLVEGAIPGGPDFSMLPSIASLPLFVLVLLLGPRLPLPVLAALGPLGAALIGVALASTQGSGDGAVLYMWPVLWMAYFFGRNATVFIVAWIGVVHALALLAMPEGVGYFDRWVDVMVSVVVVAVVVHSLSTSNLRLVERLTAEARVDALTGVLNRRGFEERLAVELARAARDGTSVGVASFDIDHFKDVNDEHGHEVGDRVLAWVGAVLADHARGVDLAARVGGEEFVVVLPGAGSDGVEAFAERVRGAVAAHGPAVERGRYGISEELRVSISAGVVASVEPVDAQTLLAAADQALYAAKRAGRNRTVRYGDAAEAPLSALAV